MIFFVASAAFVVAYYMTGALTFMVLTYWALIFGLINEIFFGGAVLQILHTGMAFTLFVVYDMLRFNERAEKAFEHGLFLREYYQLTMLSETDIAQLFIILCFASVFLGAFIYSLLSFVDILV